MFVVEIGIIEAFRSNQKVFEQKTAYQPTVVTALGSLVAIGGEVLGNCFLLLNMNVVR